MAVGPGLPAVQADAAPEPPLRQEKGVSGLADFIRKHLERRRTWAEAQKYLDRKEVNTVPRRFEYAQDIIAGDVSDDAGIGLGSETAPRQGMMVPVAQRRSVDNPGLCQLHADCKGSQEFRDTGCWR